MSTTYLPFHLIVSITLLVLSCGITIQDINDLKEELREEFDAYTDETSYGYTFRSLLASTVRLTFHDCSGPGKNGIPLAQCNGCVDFQNPDHAGLVQFAVEPLQQIYHEGKWNEIMSRADFWAAAGTIAIEYAQELANDEDELRDIPFYFGRRDCGDNYGDADDTKSFVSPIGGWQDTYQWFRDNLGWTAPQIVAIMGAHTLGSTHASGSGFDTFPWTLIPDTLDNQFYIDLADAIEYNQIGKYINGWQQAKAEVNGLYEWKNMKNQARPYIMLNSDMSMWYDLDNYWINKTIGKVDEEALNHASPVRNITLEYIKNNQKWLDDFADIWEIMIQTGYNKGELEAIYARDDGEATTTQGPTASTIMTGEPTTEPTMEPTVEGDIGTPTMEPTLMIETTFGMDIDGSDYDIFSSMGGIFSSTVDVTDTTPSPTEEEYSNFLSRWYHEIKDWIKSYL